MAEALEELRRQVQAGSDRLEDQLRMGELVLAARRQGPLPSLARLAGEAGASVSTLSRAVRLVELCDRVGRRWEHLGPSHLRAVLNLDARAQGDLLGRAERERWTVRRLHAEVDRLAPAGRRVGAGRPRRPRVVRTLRELCRIAGEADGFHGVGDLGRLPPRELRRMLEAVDDLVDECRALQGALREAVSDPPRRAAPRRP